MPSDISGVARFAWFLRPGHVVSGDDSGQTGKHCAVDEIIVSRRIEIQCDASDRSVESVNRDKVGNTGAGLKGEQPKLARELKANKIAALEAGDPELIATANIGCLTHLATGTKRSVQHWIELLDARMKIVEPAPA
jgi:hypothetical protein